MTVTGAAGRRHQGPVGQVVGIGLQREAVSPDAPLHGEDLGGVRVGDRLRGPEALYVLQRGLRLPPAMGLRSPVVKD